MVKSLKLDSFISILFLMIAVASVTLGSARVSWADSLGEEMNDFHRFLHSHSRIAADLERDPWLANNSRYLHDHDALRQFLHNHPRVRRELAVNPARVMGRSYTGDNRRYDGPGRR